QVEHRPGPAAGHVEGAGGQPRRGQGEDVGPGDIGDVDEVPRLAPVLEDVRGPTGGQGAAEDRRHAGVGRVPGHAGPVDVVVAEGDDGGTGVAAPQAAEVLLVQLGGGVDVAGVGGRRLVDRRPCHRAA